MKYGQVVVTLEVTFDSPKAHRRFVEAIGAEEGCVLAAIECAIRERIGDDGVLVRAPSRQGRRAHD